MLAGALLLIAQPLVAESSACPAAAIPFAPPLDIPLELTRRTERALANGTFLQTINYRVSFTRSGRGYRMRWQQTGQQSDGPPELLRLLSLEGESAAGELLDFTLDADGTLLGVSESPDSPARLARAIERLRTDPALTTWPERERAAITAMLDRLVALPPAERTMVHRVRGARLLMLAGRPCAAGQIVIADGTVFRSVASGGESPVFKSITHGSRPDGAQISSSTTAVVSLRTGLVESQDRRMTTWIGGSTQISRESMTLRPSEPGL